MVEHTSLHKTTHPNHSTVGQLDELRKLTCGWDGYGAEPINPDIIDAAQQVVGSLPEFREPPRVVPMTQGRVQFEWHRGPRSLEIEFETPSRIHYLKWDPASSNEKEDLLTVESERRGDEWARLNALIDWFFQG